MKFNYRHAVSKNEAKHMTTEELRNSFLAEDLFKDGEAHFEYLHYDRVIAGGVVPTSKTIKINIDKEIGAKFFLERRELGIINIGGEGTVNYDGGSEVLKSKDGLYLPVDNQKIEFSSSDAKNPAKFYLFSTLAMIEYPVVKVDISKAQAIRLGEDAQSNRRTIYQYFHPNVCKTNSLLMGLTILEPNNMWNTMPCHTHERRTECYLYLDVAESERVFHLMGEPTETRHLVMKNLDFVASAPWSIHSGVGTSNYAFIWAMGGENLDYTDMQAVQKEDLK